MHKQWTIELPVNSSALWVNKNTTKTKSVTDGDLVETFLGFQLELAPGSQLGIYTGNKGDHHVLDLGPNAKNANNMICKMPRPATNKPDSRPGTRWEKVDHVDPSQRTGEYKLHFALFQLRTTNSDKPNKKFKKQKLLVRVNSGNKLPLR